MSVQPTSDGGYIVVGSSKSVGGDISGNHGNYDCWLVKLTTEGELEWEKSLGLSKTVCAYSVHQIIDEGYVIA